MGTVEAIGGKVRNFSEGGRAVSGLVFDLAVEGLQSGWGGFCEYVLVNDHEAMVEDALTYGPRLGIVTKRSREP